MKATLIIPAYNEEDRISEVVLSSFDAVFVDEIIVVSDGSTDRTVEVVQSLLHQDTRLKVLALPDNKGKASAMRQGVLDAKNSIVVFMDADLKGVQGKHIDLMVMPVVNGHVDMCIGRLLSKKFWSTAAQVISPWLSGQRALKKELFLSIQDTDKLRMGIEMALHRYSKQHKIPFKYVFLRGVSNTHKERKMGVLQGAVARARMYREIGSAIWAPGKRLKLKNYHFKKIYMRKMKRLFLKRSRKKTIDEKE